MQSLASLDGKEWNCSKFWYILKSKADSDVDMKLDLFWFDFELHLSDGFAEQSKPLHWTVEQKYKQE